MEQEPVYTAEQVRMRQLVLDAARVTGNARAANFGEDFREDDFIAGVWTALEALRLQGVPPAWVICGWSGRALFGKNGLLNEDPFEQPTEPAEPCED